MQPTFSPLEEVLGHDNTAYCLMNVCITLAVFVDGMIALIALNYFAHCSVKLLFLLHILHHNETILPFWQG